MAKTELRKMNRRELVEIIYALQQREKELNSRIAQLEGQLSEKALKISNAGSLAEAALAVNDVVEKAQNAADQYLSSLYSSNGGSRSTDSCSQEAARELLEDTKRQCLNMINKTRAARDKVTAQCEAMKEETRKECGEYIESCIEALRKIKAENTDKGGEE